MECRSLLGSREDEKEGGTGSPPGIALVCVINLGISSVILPGDDQHRMLVTAEIIRLGFTCCLTAYSFLSLISFNFKSFLFNKRMSSALVALYLTVICYTGSRNVILYWLEYINIYTQI